MAYTGANGSTPLESSMEHYSKPIPAEEIKTWQEAICNHYFAPQSVTCTICPVTLNEQSHLLVTIVNKGERLTFQTSYNAMLEDFITMGMDNQKNYYYVHRTQKPLFADCLFTEEGFLQTLKKLLPKGDLDLPQVIKVIASQFSGRLTVMIDKRQPLSAFRRGFATPCSQTPEEGAKRRKTDASEVRPAAAGGVSKTSLGLTVAAQSTPSGTEMPTPQVNSIAPMAPPRLMTLPASEVSAADAPAPQPSTGNGVRGVSAQVGYMPPRPPWSVTMALVPGSYVPMAAPLGYTTMPPGYVPAAAPRGYTMMPPGYVPAAAPRGYAMMPPGYVPAAAPRGYAMMPPGYMPVPAPTIPGQGAWLFRPNMAPPSAPAGYCQVSPWGTY